MRKTSNMPLDARGEILARIRSANGKTATPEDAAQAWQAISREYQASRKMERAVLMELFVDRLHDYGAGVERCHVEEIASVLAARLLERGRHSLLVSAEVDPAWLGDSPKRQFFSGDGFSYKEIDGCDGVVTGCEVAIASTGTLCLAHTDTGSRRALTLLPDYHLCIVHAGCVVETVPEAIRMLERTKTQPITFISGPSATADIEMTRIQGVHGPRVLDVVLVE